MEMAKKVHSGLETYKVPKAVKLKTGKKKIQRVFRDQEELPIGADLTDNITKAIENSEYLIVICSPNTPGSLWVAKEIETFIRIHDRKHVLAVLVEGEPGESFPKELLIDEEGNPVEPLAADVRGVTSKERNNKFKTEILRLAAPILGCSYDDLKQRHRERKIRKIVTLMSAVAIAIAAAGTAFGIYYADVASKMTALADEKSKLANEKSALAEEVTKEYEAKEVNQSKFLAKEALEVLNSGDRESAVLLAMEALPSVDNPRPYVPEAEYALATSLYAYECGDRIGYDRLLKHNLTVSDMVKSEDEAHVLSCDTAGNVYVWDADTWQLLTSIKATFNENNYSVGAKAYNSDSDYIYVATEYDLTKYDYDGNVISNYNDNESHLGCYIYPEENVAFWFSNDRVSVIDLTTLKATATYDNECECSFTNKAEYIKNSNLFVIANFDSEDTNTYVSVLDVEKGELGTIKLSRGYIMDMCQTVSGNVAMITGSSNFLSGDIAKTMLIEMVNPSTLEVMWTKDPEFTIANPNLYSSAIASRAYKVEDAIREEIVVAAEANAITLDGIDGSLINSMMLSGSVTDICLRNNTDIGFAIFTTGEIDYVNFTTGLVYSDYRVATKKILSDLEILNGYMVVRVRNSSDILVMSYHEAGDLEEIAAIEDYSYSRSVSPDGKYILVNNSSGGENYNIYDAQGELLYSYEAGSIYELASGFNKEGQCVIVSSDGIAYINPFDAKCDNVSYDEMGIDSFISAAYMTENGKYAAINSNDQIFIIDLETRKLIFESEYDFTIGRAVVTEDGTKIYISPTTGDLMGVDISSGSSEIYKELGLRVVAEMRNKNYLAVSSNGQNVAMCCGDGYVRVLDIEKAKVTSQIELVAKSRPYVTFTSDNSHIILQNEDYEIICYDLRNGRYENLPDVEMSSLEYVIYDDEDGLAAICDGVSLCLLETNTYSPVAYSPRAVSFCKDDNAMLMIYLGKMYKTYYKNYETLIKEAQEQFPGAEFSQNERLRYNVD